ncbi:dTMP kinase [Corynebacterium macclintockiae]|uniref:Thymidylate kinase n=1 Tax=Corynebacterium macclintockiae TaxID=2913501 RepID=A0A9X3M7X2_9CORY|nr:MULTISPECIES: dTMP kinase [Corynebacterium]MBC6795231.1 thymidylate kinase [Corynebacterium sp. LK28]MCZ9305401.1 dTMP kinase [Corynebacterium macclintockiae]MDK8869821.1 dTMP kinase [Corynebacterium macclintockiae]OFM58292.1 thymidylate kinase [Corynebacterium sp. HMSC058E07]
MIISFEGVDGAGKNTLVTAVEKELVAREVPVARVAFPRYEESHSAMLAREALHENLGDLIDSVHGMAALFALDRAEIGAELADFDADGYVILIDRYTASNVAYSAARVGGDVAEVGEWVTRLEQDKLGIPAPDLQILVDVEADVAGQRAQSREAQDQSRARDAYERDGNLQERTVRAYRDLAQREWLSPWVVVDSTGDDCEGRAAKVADLLEEMRG